VLLFPILGGKIATKSAVEFSKGKPYLPAPFNISKSLPESPNVTMSCESISNILAKNFRPVHFETPKGLTSIKIALVKNTD
jgi:hypothetical protein